MQGSVGPLFQGRRGQQGAIGRLYQGSIGVQGIKAEPDAGAQGMQGSVGQIGVITYVQGPQGAVGNRIEKVAIAPGSGIVAEFDGTANYSNVGITFTDNGVNTASDIRRKKNIKNYGNNALYERLFNNDEEFFSTYKYIKDNTESIGVIAQEIKDLIPESIHSSHKLLNVSYPLVHAAIISELIKKIKDNDKLIEEYKEAL